MHPGLTFTIGVAVGIAAAAALYEPSDCCARIVRATESKIASKFGAAAGEFVRSSGLSKLAPGLLNLFGVS